MGKIFDYVLSEYMAHDVELNSQFFDFIPDKEITYRDVLMDYKKLQKTVNGDELHFCYTLSSHPIAKIIALFFHMADFVISSRYVMEMNG